MIQHQKHSKPVYSGHEHDRQRAQREAQVVEGVRNADDPSPNVGGDECKTGLKHGQLGVVQDVRLGGVEGLVKVPEVILIELELVL